MTERGVGPKLIIFFLVAHNAGYRKPCPGLDLVISARHWRCLRSPGVSWVLHVKPNTSRREATGSDVWPSMPPSGGPDADEDKLIMKPLLHHQLDGPAAAVRPSGAAVRVGHTSRCVSSWL